MSASLLPPNATPLMRAIEQVTAQRLAALPVDTIRSLWDAETCPVEWLPLLAWGESADYWDTAWSESRRRAYVAALRAIHERKGTLGAVRDILAAVGHADATVEEHLHRWTLDGSVTLDGWHSLGQGWARYLVRLARPVPNRIAQALRRLLRLTAPAHMRLVVLDYTAAAWRLDGTVTLDGAYNLGAA
ncbi:MAG: phage tail protein I [Gammaproteobacteria bacterium]|nr:phage tail protein I [Myxococcales bacterium]MCP5136033.1 phage tail protein I [Gammaproteobacteria bacterium]